MALGALCLTTSSRALYAPGPGDEVGLEYDPGLSKRLLEPKQDVGPLLSSCTSKEDFTS